MRIKMMSALALAIGLQTATVVADEMMEKAILENIRPVGTVVTMDESSSDTSGSGEAAAALRAGADVYGTYCMACHATGAAGAPKTGDKAAWSPRLDAKGVDGLTTSAINGLNAMPPKGTCADCADDEIKGAIEHILGETGLL